MPSPSRQAGLGLVEIMVALAIGAFMLGGVLSLVIWVSQARTELNKTSEQIENGRYAIQLLRDELRLAGFYGASQVAASSYSAPSPCTTAMTSLGFAFTDVGGAFNAQLPAALQGYAALSTTGDDVSCLSNARSDSEALLVRRAETSSVATATAGVPYIQLSQCQTDAKPMTANMDSGFTGFDLLGKDCATTQKAELWPYVLRTYYLSGCDICSPSDGIPTLKVAELKEVGGALSIVTQSLAEGIEDIHFEYGMDLDTDGAPDCYVPDPRVDTAPAAANCPTTGWSSADATNWSNVVSVRVNLLARSTEPSAGWKDEREYDLGRKDAEGNSDLEGPFNDSYRRQVYSAVVTLPNVSGVREQ
ncbi:PilW family protein [Azotobacter chroococcum]|nr:PilW family protein [Azotobacter chroococcum]